MKNNPIYKFKESEFNFKELTNLARRNGKEIPSYTTPNDYFKYSDKLKDYEFIFCLTCKIEDTDVFMFFKKNERTDKEVVLPIISFKHN